ncbi:hypothetical protein BMW24_011150 [Mycobacterium heckeshornense]|uniref:Uncharacterized protein n=1 Tax=Mycobacterium heckeshornense TaxID=110505 RepID=A0A2G8B9Z7_9MYCO|nr:hypothetical protein [Mycobacterium heckeshornense]KMV21144.1 hypothetical protein ACT16_18335 [Mycobacterium heckeshornense]MCV7033013.1 hypothetical protein [Mycobacterium heckeshornense]PIJ34569.1 hypothetical protein BMW24_011150 [Mycobacterium heckeshornense]BCO36883.1 hypothetical protein MHEC_33160 [Mycobacterium heckeshornense]
MSLLSDAARRSAIGAVGVGLVSGAMVFGAIPAAHAVPAPTSAGPAMTAVTNVAATGYGSPLPQHWWHHRGWWHRWWWWW